MTAEEPKAGASLEVAQVGLRRIGRHALVYVAGVLLSKAVSFLMLPIYTRLLTPSDYGVLELIQMTFEVVSIFAAGSLAAGVFRFYAKANSESERRAVLSSGLMLVSISYALAAVVMMSVSEQVSVVVFRSPEYSGLLRIAAGGMLGEGLTLVPFARLRILQRSRLFVSIQLAKLVFQLVFNVIALGVFHLGVRGVLLSTLVANLGLGIWLAVHLTRDVSLTMSRDALRELLQFGIPLLVSRLATFVTTFSDRYFLQAVANTAVVGLYTLSYQFGFLLFHAVTTPFSMIWEPSRFEIAKSPDRDQVYARAFKFFNLGLVTVATGLALYVEPVLRLMAAPAFHRAADIVPVILAAYVLESWTSFLNVGFMVRERTSLLTVANYITAGVAVAGYAALIPRLLGLGAALATLVACAIRAVLVYRWSQRMWPVRYDWAPVAWTGATAVAVWSVAVALPAMSLPASLALRSGLLVAYLVGVWRLPILTGSDRSRLVGVAQSARLWLRGRYAGT